MSKLFISHSFQDDALVRDLWAALADHGHESWIAPRELQGGELIWSELQKAIDEAPSQLSLDKSAFIRLICG